MTVEQLRENKEEVTKKLIVLSDFLILQAKGDPKAKERANQYYKTLAESREIDVQIRTILDNCQNSSSDLSPWVNNEGFTKEDLRAIHENEITSTTWVNIQKRRDREFNRNFKRITL